MSADLIPKTEIAFTGGLAPAESDWSDVTSYLVKGGIRRGRQRENGSIGPGSLDLELENLLGEFDPGNTGSPFAPNVRLMRPVRVSGVQGDGTVRRRFVGYVEKMPQRWGPIGRSGTVQLQAVDTSIVLSSYIFSGTADTTFPQQTTSDRVTAVLNWMGIPAGAQSVQASGIVIQASGSITGKSALEVLQDAAAAEMGSVYVSRDGVVVFRARPIPGTAAVATLGDGPSEVNYSMGVEVGYDVADVVNDFTITRTGGATTQYMSATSVGKYFRRAQSYTFPYAYDGDVASAAGVIVARYDEPLQRVPQVTFDLFNDPDAAAVIPLLDIGSVLRLNRRPETSAAISLLTILEGINEDFDALSWKTTLFLSLAPAGPATYGTNQVVVPAPKLYSTRLTRFPTYSSATLYRST